MIKHKYIFDIETGTFKVFEPPSQKHIDGVEGSMNKSETVTDAYGNKNKLEVKRMKKLCTLKKIIK